MDHRILLVDDDKALLRTMKRLVVGVGRNITAATSLAEAQALDGQFDVGVFDINLEDDCGGVLAKEALRDGRVAEAVFFTASRDEEVLGRAAAVGVIIDKPNVDLLKRALTGVV